MSDAKNTKLADYLKKQKIDARRVVAVSRSLEALTHEDRKIREAKKLAKNGDEAAKEKAKELAAKKPHSGKPVSAPTIARAIGGADVSGAAKTRILRAVNSLLATKKKPEATFRDLF